MLTVKMAQGLRDDLSDLRTKLKQLENSHYEAKQKKDRGGMMNLTKEINRVKLSIEVISNDLKDAPVKPWEPEQVWLSITLSFHYQKDFEEDKAKFLEEAARSIGYTLEGQAAGIIQSEKKAQLTSWISKLEEIEDITERVEKFYTYLPKFIKELQEEVLQGARRQTSLPKFIKEFMSTSESSNLVERARLEATADLYDNLANWNGFGLQRAKEHFESWKELNSL